MGSNLVQAQDDIEPVTLVGHRLALGVSYRGTNYSGWQSQINSNTVQDELEKALASFMAAESIRVRCAGRTDAGVHGLNQVVHFNTELHREPASWVRGTNRFLPKDIAVQWCRAVPADFNSRGSALGRRYVFLILESPVRPSIEVGVAGWSFRPLDVDRMRDAAARLIGEHDFTAFRSAQCQALSPIKTLKSLTMRKAGAYWRFEFDGTAFLHHMIRNIMGCLVSIGGGFHDPAWMTEILEGRDRKYAAPTFPADGLYFVGPYYDPALGIPEHTPPMDWLPGSA